jgi:phenylpyruvate tautomerase PptA (4-oxalocrotonate tautomerase family)
MKQSHVDEYRNARTVVMLGTFFTADDADWEFALSMIDTRYLRQHVPNPQEAKSEVIEEILSLLSAHSSTHQKSFYIRVEEVDSSVLGTAS